MKLSALLKKEAMPRWRRKNIILQIEVVDFKELILKLHVKIDDKFIGNVFLENQGERIFRPNFEHKKISEIKDFVEDERKSIEREFGYLLYQSHQFADPPFSIRNEAIILNLKSTKRKTKFVKIEDTSGDFKIHSERKWGLFLSTAKYEFSEEGIWFFVTDVKAYLIPYNDLLFFD